MINVFLNFANIFRRPAALLLISTVLLMLGTGCKKKSPSSGGSTSGITKIVWAIPDTIISYSPDYFNRLLKENGLPYELEIKQIPVGETGDYCEEVEKSKNGGEQIDILYSDVVQLSVNEVPQVWFVKNGYCLPLSEYYGDEQWSKIKEVYPEKVLKAAEFDGVLYGLPTLSINPQKKILYWSKDYAEKYDLDMPAAKNDISLLEKYADLVFRGEQAAGNKDFIVTLSKDLDLWVSDSAYFPISRFLALEETENTIKAVPKYETDDFKRINGIFERFADKGYLKDPEDYENIDSLFEVVTVLSEAKFEAVHNPENKYDYTVLETMPLSYHYQFLQNSVASWSEHPDEAFTLLSHIMTDPEMSYALTWGEEGEDYQIVDGTSDNSFESWAFQNKLLAHPKITDHSEQDELYAEIEEMDLSPIQGFIFDAETVKNESKAVVDYLMEQRNTYYENELSGWTYLYNLDDFNKNMRQKGLQTVMDEANRQLVEFLEQKEN
ncbi:MAG TPA: hypothetical protein DEQ02_05990 [Ruminococcaceae bacterium]|nr:hypothetical protein [Oscillospiraceae bacterium]